MLVVLIQPIRCLKVLMSRNPDFFFRHDACDFHCASIIPNLTVHVKRKLKFREVAIECAPVAFL